MSGDIEPTRVLAEAALAHGVKRFIYTGTIDSHDSADAERRDRLRHAARMPGWPIATSTRDRRRRAKASCRRCTTPKGCRCVDLPPGVVIGEGSPPAHWGVGMFHSDTSAQLWGDGRTKLPLVLVGDVAEGSALGLSTPCIEGQAFLLTDEPLLSAKEYVERARRRERDPDHRRRRRRSGVSSRSTLPRSSSST